MNLLAIAANPGAVFGFGFLFLQLVKFDGCQDYANNHQQKNEYGGIYKVNDHCFRPISAHNLK
jgi:hypothetical protein